MKKGLYRIIAFMVIFSIFIIPSAYAAKHKSKVRAAQSDEEPMPKASKSGIQAVSKDPYSGAIVIDAATGKVLFEDNADAKGYPASITKLMDLLILLEAIESQRLTLQNQVTVTAEASKIGGSQVYLKENEVFTVDELLYALIVQSANDAATALALHYAGSKEAFVDLMNKRAQELGMKDTVFHSVHGLPPGRDQLPDVSTPRDIAKLCQELLKHPETLQYTSTTERAFRPDAPQPFIMRSHNHLLGNMEGCDGLKTGYFSEAGFSIAATAAKKGVRAIAVVFGSKDRKVRDAKARELLSKGLMELVAAAPPAPPTPAAVVQATTPAPPPPAEAKTETVEKKSDVIQVKKSTLIIAAVCIAGIILLLIALFVIKGRRPKNTYMG
jgi:serine-type D-Ala-D-Ala carboxypeptidase (penicillin-binding protein 5/6)